MRSHAKASSAGSTMRQGKSLGAIVRGALAGRGASRSSDGSGARSGRLAVLLAALASITATMAIVAPGAGAVGFHPFLETFGSAAQPSFNDAQGIAIYQATGDVYVMDAGSTPSIKRYNPDGTPDNFSALGTNVIDGAGGADLTPQEGLGFAGPYESQIAIDNSGGATDGDIYVTQSSPNLINIFSSTGAYLGQLTAPGITPFSEACGVAVDPAGAVYVGDYSSGIHKFVPAANPPVNADHTATFTTTTNPCTLAAGAGATAGFLFPAQYFGPISKIDSSTGEVKYSFSEQVKTVSVDPSTGHVYAVKGSQFQEFDASGAASASAVASTSVATEPRAVAVRGANGHVYVSRTEHLEVFGALVHSPNVAIDPASGITPTEATLNGTVNAEGVAITECKFEWGSTTQSGFPNSVPCEQAVPADSSDHAVSADINGLSAGGSQYHFRLVAKNADASSSSDTETFRVGAAINGIAASAGSEEATLLGSIVPSGGATEYHFEWGTTSSYGNTTPTGNLPAGEDALTVFAELTGLAAGTTYHYRLVASNGFGTTTGPDQTFTTSTAPPPLPERGYEIASQYPTGGVPINEFPGGQTASEDGNSLAVSSLNPLAHSTLPPMPDDPNSELAGGTLRNLFTRGSGSWQRTEVGLGGFSWSGDLQRFLTTTQTQPPGSDYQFEDARVDPDDRNNSVDLYQWQPDGKLTWISRDPRIAGGTPQSAEGNAELASVVGSFTMSADGHTVVFKSKRQLLDADTTPVNAFGDRPFRVYKWEDGQLSFIGRRPDGSVPADGSELGDYYYLASDRYAVSRDGSRVIFSAHRHDGVGDGPGYTSAGTGAALYVQTDGQPTVEATKEEGVPSLPAPEPYAVAYRGAAVDGSRVFFTSASRFTPESGASFTDSVTHDDDLYVYDVAADKLRDLTPRLDGIDDTSIDPATADRARVLGVLANSEDGKRVYFAAEGVYPTAPNPEGELPQGSSPNLYMAELDSISGPVKLRFIATLGGEDRGDWQAAWDESNGPNNINSGKTALASPDGSVLGFGSRESLTGQPLAGTEQLFVYDTARDRLECASCPSDGTLPVADVNGYSISASGLTADWQSRGGVRRWMSDDGTVFFTTLTPLLGADENTVADVYEFREGELRLVTTGTGTAESMLSDASVDGSTVFVNTQEALAPQDKEPGITKIYAARVGGGFAYVPPPPPCDFNAGACEGAPSTAPETPGAGTAAFEGPGNTKPHSRRTCPKGKRKVRAKGKTRCVKRHGRAHQKRNANNNRRAGR